MRKYKHFIEKEYTIVDVEKDDGVGDEYFVWILQDESIEDPKTNLPVRFKAQPMDCAKKRKNWYENYLEYIGSKMTIKFQEYTKDGIPRFPKAKCFREDQ